MRFTPGQGRAAADQGAHGSLPGCPAAALHPGTQPQPQAHRGVVARSDVCNHVQGALDQLAPDRAHHAVGLRVAGRHIEAARVEIGHRGGAAPRRMPRTTLRPALNTRLQDFARHVERQVGAVHHALDERQVARHQVLVKLVCGLARKGGRGKD